MPAVPVLEQYQRVKQAHPDAIVLFRLGDFYETFGEDAERAAPILGVTLTGREMGKGQRFPMAGVPYHACEAYVGKLLKAGLRVAVCDQVEEPVLKGRGLVRREVVRVLTPGMVLEDAYLEGARSNYAVAVCIKAHYIGVAALDCSTGELGLIRVDPDLGALRDELARLHPAELIAAELDGERLSSLAGGAPISVLPASDFDARAAGDRLRQLLGVDTLAAFGVEEWPEALAAAGALLRYAERAHLTLEPALLRLHAEHPQGFMHLDAVTRRSLGLAGVPPRSDEDLVAFLDLTVTSMGARCLRRWLDRPLRVREPLEARLESVAQLAGDPLTRGRLRAALRRLHDVERLVSRAGQGLGTPRDLVQLRATLEAVPAVRTLAASPLLALPPASAQVERLVAELRRALVDEPPSSLRDGGAFSAGYDPDLDAIRDGSRSAREWIAALEAAERQRTGIRSLRVGFNQVFGYYLEVSHANRALVPEEYVRKQTLVNAERYITVELKERETLVLNARSAMGAREQELFRGLARQVTQAARDLLALGAALGELDALAALAEVASRERWVRPRLRQEPGLQVRAGRHPLVERALGPGRFVPNDLSLDPDRAQIALLSGPNMAGKSTYLRQSALIVLLAQVGSFVPAVEAEVGLCDRIFTRVGAHDELARGLSTFMVEMVETAHILAHAGPRSLLVFDEVGRGTSTYDGVSIAQALLEYVHEAPQLRSLTLFATHFHELTALAERLPRLRNFRMEVREEGEKVVFLHQVVQGGADRSYGIHVAELAGLPRQVVVRARQILQELEGARPLEKAAPSDQLSLPLEQALLEELRQLDLERLTPKEALDKLYSWQGQHAGA